ncbi:MAG: hypothetical protein K940chlam3_01599 [Chlamydiae bacterium]|nr:hypothetical protein [Chlamydiota bacterium]
MPKSILTSFVQDLVKGLGLDIDLEDSPSYTLEIQDKAVQLELDDTGDFIFVSTVIGKVPSGMYRESVLEQALLSNGYPPPQFGYFGYDLNQDILVLHQRFHVTKLTKKTLMDAIPGFIQMSTDWGRAIGSASVPIAAKPDPSQAPSILEIMGIKT